MHYAILLRTPDGENTLMKSIYRSIVDAQDAVMNAHPWLSEDGWMNTEESSVFELTDGSSFIIYRES